LFVARERPRHRRRYGIFAANHARAFQEGTEGWSSPWSVVGRLATALCAARRWFESTAQPKGAHGEPAPIGVAELQASAPRRRLTRYDGKRLLDGGGPALYVAHQAGGGLSELRRRAEKGTPWLLTVSAHDEGRNARVLGFQARP